VNVRFRRPNASYTMAALPLMQPIAISSWRKFMTSTRQHATRVLRAAWTCAAALSALVCLVPAAALFIPDASHAADTLTARMQVSKEELATPQGRQAVDVRLSATAARLCRQFRNTSSVADREAYAECTHDALASARAQMTVGVAAAKSGAQRRDPAAGAAPMAEHVAGN
jgi:UrcA family protein